MFFADPQQSHTNDALTPILGVLVGTGPGGNQRFNFGPQTQFGAADPVGPGLQPYHQTLVLTFQQGNGKPCRISIFGAQSGIQYYSGVIGGIGIGNPPGQFPLAIPVLGAYDQGFFITWVDTNVNGAFWLAAESTSHIVTPRSNPKVPAQVSSGVVVCPGGGATTPIVAAPGLGQFHEYQFLSWVPNVAGAAGNAIIFRGVGGTPVYFLDQFGGALGDGGTFPCRLRSNNGLEVNNGLTVAASVVATWELLFQD